MAKDLLYIVHEKCVHNYETRWEDYHAYSNKEIAAGKMEEIKSQDMMPIVEEENYEITCDEPNRFEARNKYSGEKGFVLVKIITTPLEA